MSSKQLQLKIITPEKTVLVEVVDSVTIPTTLGEIGIFPNHIPLVTTLKSGDIVAKKGEEFIPVAVVGGFVEIKNNEVAILADFAEHVSEISDEVVARAQARAEELKQIKDKAEVVDFERFETELERSITRARIADKWKGKKYRA